MSSKETPNPEGAWSPVAANYLSTVERAANGRVGGLKRNADPAKAAEAMRKARKGQEARWERDARAIGIVDEEQVAHYIAKRLDEHMAMMTARSLRARRKAKAEKLRAQAEALEAIDAEADGQ